MTQRIQFRNTQDFSIRRKVLMATTALAAAGFVTFAPQAVQAGDNVGAHDVWEFENTKPVESSLGYVKYKGDTIIDNLTQEDIGELGRVDLDARITVAKGVESGAMQILGTLKSTGDVYILDTNGVIFGKNSVVDVAGLVATTGTIADADILDNDGKVNIKDIGTDGVIDLQGTVSVSQAGLAAFVAPTVKNSGIINARMGKVALAAGEEVTIDLYGDQLVEIAAGEQLADAYIENSGAINAEGGVVQITADAAKSAVDNIINMSGVINASSASVEGGKIILDGGDAGTVKIAGTIDASGTKGGNVAVKGQNISTTKTSKIAANSTDTVNGQAGSATLIADNNGVYKGAISVLGKDGFVETSAANLGVQGDVTLGEGGTWLLDPTNIYIVSYPNLDNGDVDLSDSPFAPEDGVGSPDNNDGLGNEDSEFYVYDMLINNALNAGSNVYLQTGGNVGGNDGDIYINADAKILKTAGGDSVLRLDAHDDIVVNGTIGATGAGKLSVELIADFDGSGGDSDVIINNVIDTNGGAFTAHASDSVDVNAVVTTGTAYFDAPTVNLAADVDASSAGTPITGTASTVNVLNDTAEIQDGVDAASTVASTVNVAAGAYNESVNLYKNNMNVRGANYGVSAIDGIRAAESIVDPNSPGFTITGNDVILDGFEITGATGADGYGVYINGGKNAIIRNNEIHDNEIAGVFGTDADGADIYANEIKSSPTGIQLQNTSTNAKIHDNEIHTITGGADEGDGIRVYDSRFVTVNNNNIHDVGDEGIFARGNVNGLKIHDNTIDNTGTKVTETGNGIEVLLSHGTARIYDNTVTNAEFYGIWAKQGYSDSAFYIDGNTVNHAGEIGIGVDANAKSVSGNSVDNTGDHGIFVKNSNGAVINNNVIGTNGADKSIGGDGIQLLTSDNVVIQGNEITNTFSYAENIGSGIQVLSSAGTQIGGAGAGQANVIYNTDWDGVRLENVSNVTVEGNDIDDSQRVGVYARDFHGVNIKNNDIDGTNEFAGISVYGMNFGTDAVITGNHVDSTDDEGILARNITSGLVIDSNVVGVDVGNINNDGIEVRNSPDAVVSNNTVKNTLLNGIYINNSNSADVTGNTVSNTGANGILVNPSNDSYIFSNIVTHTGNDGIRVEAGTGHLIERNMVMNTAADGIHVLDHEGTMFGYANILNNVVVHTGDDGIDAENGESVNIERNTVGHIQNGSWDADGIRAVDVNHTVIKWNGVADVKDDGIRVKGGNYAGVFGNHVIMTGDEGIEVSGVSNYDDLPTMYIGADVDYPTLGYAVSIEGNEVVLTGEHGIYVHDSESTRIVNNDVLMAGIDGEDYESELEIKALVEEISEEEWEWPEESYFTMNWGNGDGIKVENVYREPHAAPVYTLAGEGDYPVEYADWTVLIQGNDVAWTGGDGIDVNNAGATLIGGNGEGEGNSVYQAGIDWTTFEGFGSYEELTSTGPFADVDARHTVWWGEAWPYSGPALADLTDSVGEHLTGSIVEVGHDTHDGIRATNIENDGYIGAVGNVSENPEEPSYYGYALNIIGNNVNTTGDDGIEAGWTSSALIQNNHVMGAGIGGYYGLGAEVDPEYRYNYGVGDYYGADGIHAHDITGESDLLSGSYGENYEEYALVIDGNVIDGAADDGIEVSVNGSGYDDFYLLSWYNDLNGRTLITNNTVDNVGVFGSGFNWVYDDVDYADSNSTYYEYYATAGDGYGSDGIHVRDVQDHTYRYDSETGTYTYGNGLGLEISNNDIAHTGDDGIEVLGAESEVRAARLSISEVYPYEGYDFGSPLRVLIDGNTIDQVGYGYGYDYGAADGWGADGIHVRNVIAGGSYAYYDSELGWVYGDLFNDGTSVTITNNTLTTISDDGIQVLDSGNSVIDNNSITDVGFGYDGYEGNGGDGIHVKTGFFDYEYGYDAKISEISEGDEYEYPYYYGYFLSTSTDITNNTINNVGDDGIDVENVSDVLVADNDVDNVGDDGIEVVGLAGYFEEAPYYEFGVSLVEPTFKVEVLNNTVDNSDDTGIVVENFDEIDVGGNDVTSFGYYGLNVAGDYNGNVRVFGNNFTAPTLPEGTLSGPVLANFQSGIVDLTGEGNAFRGGRVGIRFAPTEGNADALKLIDNNPSDIYEGTLGAQYFRGQSQYFVELLNGALFNPGQPSIYNALQSTYYIPGFGDFNPSDDGLMTQEQYDFLEGKFYHFVDLDTLGLFFFGFVGDELAGINNFEDFLKDIGAYEAGTNALSVTILGLPSVFEGQFGDQFNAITPAAGGEGTTAAGLPGDTNGDGVVSAEEAAAVDPAAGAENVTCWGDAVNAAGAGTAVSYSFDTSFESALADAGSCGLASAQ